MAVFRDEGTAKPPEPHFYEAFALSINMYVFDFNFQFMVFVVFFLGFVFEFVMYELVTS